MSTITTIQGTDVISNSRTDINTNFSNLNTDKIETSYLDTDTTLAANSDSKIATQKATKTYVDSVASPTGKSWNEYAVDAVGTDSYGITLTGFTAYVAGQTFKFKAGTANTGACSLNVNGLGAKTIKKDVSSDLATGDILANQIVTVIYDGTNMQMISKPAPSPIDIQTFTSSGTYTKPLGAVTVVVRAWGGGGSGASINSTAGGGGGGGCTEVILDASSVGNTETVTIGDGGTAVTNAVGNDGGNTTFGSLVTAYGGQGGFASTGGGGGGNVAKGSAGAGGGINGGAVGSSSVGGSADFGGAGGGNLNNIGGSSNWGGGGGGGCTGGNGSGGGKSYFGGGGGGANGSGTQTGGTSTYGGAGGNGHSTSPTAGTQPAGGGGGCSAASASGAGGKGKCIVTTYF